MHEYHPGDSVVVVTNPHRPSAANVVAIVVEFRKGAGFAGCDLAYVEFQDPADGSVHVLPVALALVSDGEPDQHLAAAEGHEEQAAELRRLAAQVR